MLHTTVYPNKSSLVLTEIEGYTESTRAQGSGFLLDPHAMRARDL